MVKKMRNTIIRHYSAAKAAKNSSRLALFVGLAIWGATAHATPIQRSFEGELVGPEVFNYVWNAHIAEPSENASGKTPIKDSMQSVGAGYAGACVPREACGAINQTYFTAKASGEYVDKIDGLEYYKVNDNLAVGVKISVLYGGGTSSSTNFIGVPFNNVSNAYYAAKPSYQYYSGSKVSLSLYIIKPFLGESIIPSRLVASLYASTASDYGSIPIAEVYLSGRITVDQTCNFNAGTVLPVINFGNMESTTGWKEVGKGPDNKERTVNLDIVCDNLPDKVHFKNTLQGEPASDNARFLKTGNPDIGIRYIAADGREVPPLPAPGTAFPATAIPFTYLNGTLRSTGSTSIKVAPVSTTGKEPQKGSYTATATIGVQLE